MGNLPVRAKTAYRIFQEYKNSSLDHAGIEQLERNIKKEEAFMDQFRRYNSELIKKELEEAQKIVEKSYKEVEAMDQSEFTKNAVRISLLFKLTVQSRITKKMAQVTSSIREHSSKIRDKEFVGLLKEWKENYDESVKVRSLSNRNRQEFPILFSSSQRLISYIHRT